MAKKTAVKKAAQVEAGGAYVGGPEVVAPGTRDRIGNPHVAALAEIPRGVVMVEVDVDLSTQDWMPGHVTRHVSMRLTHRQAVALRRVANGLKARGALMHNGKAVESTCDGLRWLLDGVAEQVEE